ncbi:MAG TPA: DUF455 family protein [Planctomycetota bacterium]|nr:DUF455 family protein [Planctomycetota bacterium]
MNVRSRCESIVLGETLAEKLAPRPADLIDDERGAPTKIRAPGRPRELAFASVRTPMPRPNALASAEKRAVALHRFANHELQAIEIMAWAILAFPDAPADFRAGLLATLEDEQAHLGLYVARLDALGTPFGSLPVNDYFWKKVGDLESPLHYLAAMGLTFEAANLDHSLAYEEAFARAGDRESAAIVARVHEDEVGHVRFAVSWVNRWKRAGQSDLGCYLEHVRFPLGLNRARGPVVQREPRERAGFSDEFLEAVERAPASPLQR